MKISAALAKELCDLPKQAIIMVIGEVDTGKTTLVMLLAHWFLSASRKVAIVDADIGQADIGPPGFVSYGFIEQQCDSLRSVTRRASYMVGSTSPYGRALNVVAGVQACVRDARSEGADIVLIDTSGLARGPAGVQLKCAKAEAVKPHLIIALSTPGVETVATHLGNLGFRVRRFLPLPGARARDAEERKNARISRWASYLGDNPTAVPVDISQVKVHCWWGETRNVDTAHVPHGTVASVQDPNHPGFHIPCVWAHPVDGDSNERATVLVPSSLTVNPKVIWVSGYRLGLEGTRVISA